MGQITVPGLGRVNIAGDVPTAQELSAIEAFVAGQDAAPTEPLAPEPISPAPETITPTEPPVIPPGTTTPPEEVAATISEEDVWRSMGYRDPSPQTYPLDDPEAGAGSYTGALVPLRRTADGELELSVPGALQEVWRGVTAPFRAFEGEIPPDEVVEEALNTALIIGGGVRAPRVTRREIQREARTAGDPKVKAGERYSSAEAAEVTITGDSYAKLLAEMEQRLLDERYVPQRGGQHSQIYNAMEALGRSIGEDLDFKVLEMNRQLLKPALRSPDPSVQRLAVIMRDMLDNYVNKLSADDIVEGGAGVGAAKQAAADLTAGRAYWSQGIKADILGDWVDKARLAKDYETSIRNSARKFLEPNNKKARSNWSDAELAFVRRLAKGSLGRNMLRMLGIFSRGIVGTGVGGGLGFYLGGPVGAVGLPAAGLAARRVGQALTSRDVNTLQGMVATGLNPPPSLFGARQITGSLLASETPESNGNPSGLLGGLR